MSNTIRAYNKKPIPVLYYDEWINIYHKYQQIDIINIGKRFDRDGHVNKRMRLSYKELLKLEVKNL